MLFRFTFIASVKKSAFRSWIEVRDVGLNIFGILYWWFQNCTRVYLGILLCLMLVVAEPVMAGGDHDDFYADPEYDKIREEINLIKDKGKKLRALLPYAEQGNAKAQRDVGFYYLDGHGVSKDTKKAFHWFLKAAEQGEDVGQLMVGNSYALGDGVSKDLKKSVYWYRKSAEQGHDQAQEALGYHYIDSGEDLPQGYGWLILSRVGIYGAYLNVHFNETPFRSASNLIDAMNKLTPEEIVTGVRFAVNNCQSDSTLQMYIKELESGSEERQGEDLQSKVTDHAMSVGRSSLVRLREFKDLYTEGLISEDEFNSKKQEILDAL